MSFPSTILALSGLVGYYRLGEASGTNAVDASGNGNDGTYVGSPTLGAAGLLAGDSDTAMSTGSVAGKYVNLPAAIKNALNGSAWSIGMVVKLAGNTNHGLFIGPKGGANARIFGTRFGGATTKVGFAQENAAVVGSWAMSSSTTHDVVITYGSGVLKIYVDGSALDAGVSYSFTGSFTGTVTISSPTSGSDGSENATYDEFFFTTTTLSSGDASAIHTARTTSLETHTTSFSDSATAASSLGDAGAHKPSVTQSGSAASTASVAGAHRSALTDSAAAASTITPASQHRATIVEAAAAGSTLTPEGAHSTTFDNLAAYDEGVYDDGSYDGKPAGDITVTAEQVVDTSHTTTFAATGTAASDQTLAAAHRYALAASETTDVAVTDAGAHAGQVTGSGAAASAVTTAPHRRVSLTDAAVASLALAWTGAHVADIAGSGTADSDIDALHTLELHETTIAAAATASVVLVPAGHRLYALTEAAIAHDSAAAISTRPLTLTDDAVASARIRVEGAYLGPQPLPSLAPASTPVGTLSPSSVPAGTLTASPLAAATLTPSAMPAASLTAADEPEASLVPA